MPKKSGFTTFMKTERGFTLIELLMVVVIISILSLIGLTIFANIQKSARDAARKSDIEAISRALEAHYSFRTGYPVLNNDWFVNSQLPKDPFGENYIGVPNTLGWTYQICADLEEDQRGTNDTTSGFSSSNTKDFCREQQQ